MSTNSSNEINLERRSFDLVRRQEIERERSGSTPEFQRKNTVQFDSIASMAETENSIPHKKMRRVDTNNTFQEAKRQSVRPVKSTSDFFKTKETEKKKSNGFFYKFKSVESKCEILFNKHAKSSKDLYRKFKELREGLRKKDDIQKFYSFIAGKFPQKPNLFYEVSMIGDSAYFRELALKELLKLPPNEINVIFHKMYEIEQLLTEKILVPILRNYGYSHFNPNLSNNYDLLKVCQRNKIVFEKKVISQMVLHYQSEGMLISILEMLTKEEMDNQKIATLFRENSLLTELLTHYGLEVSKDFLGEVTEFLQVNLLKKNVGDYDSDNENFLILFQNFSKFLFSRNVSKEMKILLDMRRKALLAANIDSQSIPPYLGELLFLRIINSSIIAIEGTPEQKKILVSLVKCVQMIINHSEFEHANSLFWINCYLKNFYQTFIDFINFV